MSCVAFQARLSAERLKRSLSLRCLHVAKERGHGIEDKLHVGVSLDEPLEVVIITVALDPSDASKRMLQAMKDLGDDVGLAMLGC
jgi:hypothetical protein